jgi:hypothetical protein
MTIEQRPELNRFVDPSIPLTWQWRWCQFKVTLPIWCLVLAFFLELWLLMAWLGNRWDLQGLTIILSVWLGMILFVLGMAEIQTRIRQRSKRVIEFKNDKLFLKPAKNGVVLWKRVSKFQLEPLPETPPLMILKLFLHGRPNKRTSGRAFWGMVLENPSQVQELVRFLQTRRTDAPSNFETEILERPVPPETHVAFPFLGLSLGLGGYFLLMHGAPMLLGLLNHNHHDSDGGSRFTSEQRAQLARFITQHFSSTEEFRHFFLTLGICLTTVGVALMALGWWLMKRKPQIALAPRSA